MYRLSPYRKRNVDTDFQTMNQVMSSFFNDTFWDMSDSSGKLTGETQGFRVDVREEDNAYVLDAELPGFIKEEITIEVKNELLTILAKKEVEENVDTENYIRKERKATVYNRSFTIEGIDENAIKAKYENGILTLELPKVEVVDTTKRIEIQ